MLNKIITIALITTVLMFSGCSSSDEGADALQVQTMIDSGDYAGVIALLEPTDATTTNEDRLALASAYMGKAGFTLSDVIGIMATSTDTNSSGFASFATSISANRSATALSDLGNAGDYYLEIVPNCLTPTNPLTSQQEDICLFIGLASIVKTATTLSYLGDLSSFGDGNSDELTASACAMQYAFDGTTHANCLLITPTTPDVTFDSNNTYTPLKVDTAIASYYYLMTPGAAPQMTIITDGSCSLDFTACTAANNTDCYACPVVQTAGEDDLTVATLLTDVLNDGLDSIGSIGIADVTADVDDYKADLDTSGDGIITTDEIIDYINLNNL